MIVYFFTKGDMNAGSSRQRAFLLAEELNKAGQKACVYQPLKLYGLVGKLKKRINFAMFFLNIKKGDIIYLQRTVYNRKFFIWIIFYKMFFDFDDAIYFQHYFRTKILTKIADVVIVGSHALKDWAININKNVFMIPTSVDHKLYEKYSMLKRPPNNKTIIGWVGNGIDHYKNLVLLKPVFERLIADGLNFKFRLIGALKDKRIYEIFEEIKGLDVDIVDFLDWADYESIPKAIQFFDIGLMPLIDDEWHRGKCAFKAIEYMACGVPVVISPVGENNYLVQDNESGYFAGNIDEWHVKIKKLIMNERLRKELGIKGQQVIMRSYSYETNVVKIKNIIENL